MEAWQTILLAFGGNAALLGILAWAGKSLASQWFRKDLERHKFDLQKSAIEHQVRFSRLHEKRAEVIAELYRVTIEFVGAAESLTNPMEFSGEPTKKEKSVIFGDKATQFRKYYLENKIYLSEESCVKIDSLWDKAWGASRSYTFWLHQEEDSENMKRTFDAWTKGWDTMSKEIPDMLRQLQLDFRSILGVE